MSMAATALSSRLLSAAGEPDEEALCSECRKFCLFLGPCCSQLQLIASGRVPTNLLIC
jgi:hypothetical protein